MHLMLIMLFVVSREGLFENCVGDERQAETTAKKNHVIIIIIIIITNIYTG